MIIILDVEEIQIHFQDYLILINSVTVQKVLSTQINLSINNNDVKREY
jgi:hypothetical protein